VSGVTDWGNFFVAEAGASAALAGLLFVAVSINLSRILAFAQLPGRAAEALISILSVLAVASCGLIPGQGLRALGVEAVASGLIVLMAASSLQLRAREHRHPQDRPVVRTATAQLPAVPFIVGGAILIHGQATGVYWLAAGAMASLAGGVFSAWVLLVEIQR
jgi:modulator of FtsH protease